MNLQTYERKKFDLAELVRSAEPLLPKDSDQLRETWRSLLSRLAEDRFNLVVLGRYSRGKTSLMNAILGMDRLPTGILPLTSVITMAQYGSPLRVYIHFQASSIPREIRLEDLPSYITQNGNPGNERKLASAEVQLPSELLRRGFVFVDTPGLGSPSEANTLTTERFLPEADALLLVTGFDGPLSEEERRILRDPRFATRRLFVVVNKADTVALEERRETLAFVSELLSGSRSQAPELFSVSARDAMEARRRGDQQALLDSGILDLEHALVQFLTQEKLGDTLLRTCERLFELTRSIPTSSESVRLLGQARTFAAGLSLEQAKTGVSRPSSSFDSSGLETRQNGPCNVCENVVDKVRRVLSQLQYELGTDDALRELHSRRGGFCGFHTWQYESLASPQGIAIGYAPMLTRLSECLRACAGDRLSAAEIAQAIDALIPSQDTCPACTALKDAAFEAVSAVVRHLRALPEREPQVYCLPHLQQIIATIGDVDVARHLVRHEAEAFGVTADNMRRFAMKNAALRRALLTDEERRSPLGALALLVGARAINEPPTVEFEV